MKKYYFKETGNEIQFGDMIELDFTENLKNGRVKYHHLECKFVPELIPLLLESGLVEVRKEKEKVEDSIPSGLEEAIEELITKQEELEARIKALEKK